MDDVWFHIAGFCDTKERGRLYASHKHVFVYWNDLIVYHTGSLVSIQTFRNIITGQWESLSKVAKLERQLSLCSGRYVSLWSPWCCPNSLQLKSRSIQVYFKKSRGHARFIYWVRRLVCAKYTCSLLHTDYLVARYKCPRGYTIRQSTPRGIHIDRLILPKKAFRVKLMMQDASHRLVDCGYPKLYIQCFEFKELTQYI